MVAVMFLYQITIFYNKTQRHHFWNFILMTQCKLCTRAAAAVAIDKDRSPMGADVVFTDCQTPFTLLVGSFDL